MKGKNWLTLVLVFVLGIAVLGGQFSRAAARNTTIMEFSSMVGIPAAFTGAQNPIRGINGGGLPWTIASAQGELSTSGKLEIQVQGLVLAAGVNAGANPIANFKAIVSCLKGDATVENVSTGLFPATTGPASAGGGDAKIETNLTLPQLCIAPIIFVTSPTGSWFAATGNS